MKRFRILCLVVPAVFAMTGCCEVMHLGWARSVGPREWRELRMVDRALAIAAKQDDRGNYNAEACAKACSTGSETEIKRCYPVAAAVPQLERRRGEPGVRLSRPIEESFVVCVFWRDGYCAPPHLTRGPIRGPATSATVCLRPANRDEPAFFRNPLFYAPERHSEGARTSQ